MSEKKTDIAEDSKAATTATETKAAKKNKTEKTAETKGGFCVYIGPTIQGVIQSGTIYSENKAKVLDSLADIIKANPLIKTMIVDDRTLSEDRVKVKTPGNILYVNYNKLAKGTK